MCDMWYVICDESIENLHLKLQPANQESESVSKKTPEIQFQNNNSDDRRA